VGPSLLRLQYALLAAWLLELASVGLCIFRPMERRIARRTESFLTEIAERRRIEAELDQRVADRTRDMEAAVVRQGEQAEELQRALYAQRRLDEMLDAVTLPLLRESQMREITWYHRPW
jgi:hypothetical protein